MAIERFVNETIHDLFGKEIKAIQSANGTLPELLNGVDEARSHRLYEFAVLGLPITQIAEISGGIQTFFVERQLRQDLNRIRIKMQPKLQETSE